LLRYYLVQILLPQYLQAHKFSRIIEVRHFVVQWVLCIYRQRFPRREGSE
jgi:hypothetical protein